MRVPEDSLRSVVAFKISRERETEENSYARFCRARNFLSSFTITPLLRGARNFFFLGTHPFSMISGEK